MSCIWKTIKICQKHCFKIHSYEKILFKVILLTYCIFFAPILTKFFLNLIKLHIVIFGLVKMDKIDHVEMILWPP
jgi:hypothetical protein